MRYICLIYSDEGALANLPHQDGQRLMEECVSYSEELMRSGHLLGGEKLEPATTATTIWIRNGKAAVTDGPHVETKEQLGGFYMIEARDLNEAIQIASKIPPARFGCVEVRPIWEDRQQTDNTTSQSVARIS